MLPDQVKILTREFLAQHPAGLLVILGPTASGKTGMSVGLAHYLLAELNQTAEIISVDSRQVYKDCDISSAKISEAEKEGIRHHGIDIVGLETEYSVFDWQGYCTKTIQEIQARGHIAMLAGGTMLWLDAVTENYEFDAQKGIKSDRKKAPQWPCLKMGLRWPREVLYKRINQRAVQQFEKGLIDETKRVMHQHPAITKSAFTSFGYQEIQAYQAGLMTYEEALTKNQQRNRNYAKKQLTWWRGREDVHWIDF
jgi:tRNA dimethylallyltransferase